MISEKIRKRIHWLFYQSETAPVRFWFGLASFGFSSFLLLSDRPLQTGSEYYYMTQLAPGPVWGLMFLVHAISLWYGVFTERHNKILLMSEGVLGTAAWVAAAAATSLYTGALGGQSAGALIALWILVRYPTHWEWDNA